MSTKEEMYAAIELWQKSGLSKKQFLTDQKFSEPKFNYWISKWKLSQVSEVGSFEQIDLNASGSSKVLEITTSRGLKILVFA
jgi:hypothetical protein